MLYGKLYFINLQYALNKISNLFNILEFEIMTHLTYS